MLEILLLNYSSSDSQVYSQSRHTHITWSCEDQQWFTAMLQWITYLPLWNYWGCKRFWAGGSAFRIVTFTLILWDICLDTGLGAAVHSKERPSSLALFSNSWGKCAAHGVICCWTADEQRVDLRNPINKLPSPWQHLWWSVNCNCFFLGLFDFSCDVGRRSKETTCCFTSRKTCCDSSAHPPHPH